VPAHQFPVHATPADGSDADLAAADVVVYLVDHADFDREAIVSAGVPVLDCRRALQGPTVEHL
jgi:hypothetical protein